MKFTFLRKIYTALDVTYLRIINNHFFSVIFFVISFFFFSKEKKTHVKRGEYYWASGQYRGI